MAGARSDTSERITLGFISGAHGVNGWVKVHSFTEPREAILNYQPWLLGEAAEAVELRAGRKHGKSVLAKFDGVEDRDQAVALKGALIAVQRVQLPDPGAGSFYWADLLGLEVMSHNDEPLGRIEKMMSTGANDVMVVRGERERLIPFVMDQTVTRVDFETGKIWVDWDPDF